MNTSQNSTLDQKLLKVFRLTDAELILNQQGELSQRQKQVIQARTLSFLTATQYRTILTNIIVFYLLISILAICSYQGMLILALLPAALLAGLALLGHYISTSNPLGMNSKAPRLDRVAGQPIFLLSYYEKPNLITAKKRCYRLLVGGVRLEVTGPQYQLLKGIVSKNPNQSFLFMALRHSKQVVAVRLINMTADDFFSD